MISTSLKKQAKLRESVLSIIVMLCFVYALFAYFYTPNSEKADVIKIDLEETVVKKQGLEKLITALKKKQKEALNETLQDSALEASSDTRIQLLKKYKDPIFTNVAEFLNAVNQHDFKSGVDLDGVKYGAEIKNNGYSSTAFSLSVTGRFTNIVEFIRRLEDLPILISFDQIKIEVNKTNPKMVVMELGGMYFQLESKNG